MRIDESNIGAWLWLVLIVVINATWISMDIWLRRNGHEYLTTEFKEALRHPYLGCAVVCGMTLTITIFVWHMFTGKP